MEPLTPEQNKQLSTWASQRDSILLEIANKTTERDQLIATNRNLASSNTEIADRIEQSVGRIQELAVREYEQGNSISCELAGLETKKSTLQTEIAGLLREIELLSENKNIISENISTLKIIHDAVFSRAGDIERIIGETVSLNSTNAREIKNILIEAGAELKKIIDIGAENVTVTNRAIAEIPKMIVDLHKDVLERRHFNRHKIT